MWKHDSKNITKKASLWAEENKTDLEKYYRKQPWTGEKTCLHNWEGGNDTLNINKLVEGGMKIWYLQFPLWGKMWGHLLRKNKM